MAPRLRPAAVPSMSLLLNARAPQGPRVAAEWRRRLASKAVVREGGKGELAEQSSESSLECGATEKRLSGTGSRPDTSSLNAEIRRVFDEPAYWKRHYVTAKTGVPTGLFGYPEFSSPEGWKDATRSTLRVAESLVGLLGSMSAEEQVAHSATVLKILDQLSDTLCQVLDAAELVRTVHPDERVVDAAVEAMHDLTTYMNQLNTHTGLYEATKRIVDDRKAAEKLTKAEQGVAKIFLADFEKSGIHLSASQRRRFVDLSQRILILGQSFQIGAHPDSTHIVVSPATKLGGLPGQFRSSVVTRSGLFGRSDSAKVPLSIGGAVLKHVEDVEVRRDVYKSLHTSSKQQLDTLEELLSTRMELAKLLGKQSYAHLFLTDKMVRTPENLEGFLNEMITHRRPRALADLDVIRRSKQRDLGTASLPALHGWDRDYYTRLAVAEQSERTGGGVSAGYLSEYFSIGTVFEGLSQLFSRLYGIAFVPEPVRLGEVWHEEVRKFLVVDVGEDGNHSAARPRATLYCDLFHRPGKNCGPSHYTVRCSRRVDDDVPVVGGPGVGVDPGGGEAVPGKPGRYQLPTMAVICNFERQSPNTPSLLSWPNYETLFHEMGHAMHSMLGTTEHHNVAGTRCPIDFVEVPSILMESFASDPRVVGLFARHYKTDEPLPPGILESYKRDRDFLSAVDPFEQILLAKLDVELHTTSPSSSSSFDHFSTQIYHALQARHGLFDSDSSSSSSWASTWQGQFSHLHGYGAGYYSYIFGKALAGQIWRANFATDPLDREAGRRYREHVLSWGGGRDPWESVEAVLEDVARSGGNDAGSFVGTESVKEKVALVGKWGTL